MNHHPPELRTAELFATLSGYGVRYVAVGGVAAWLHGARRPTPDLDICPDLHSQNMERLAGALDALDARLRLRPELGDAQVRPNSRLLAEIPSTHWRTRAGNIDILYAISAGPRGAPEEFPELNQRAVIFRFRDAHVVVAGLPDIIRAKAYANRSKDRAAIPELRRLATQPATWRRGQVTPTPISPRRSSPLH